jgi:hypothetical protein
MPVLSDSVGLQIGAFIAASLVASGALTLLAVLPLVPLSWRWQRNDARDERDAAIGPTGESRVDRLEANADEAMALADRHRRRERSPRQIADAFRDLEQRTPSEGMGAEPTPEMIEHRADFVRRVAANQRVRETDRFRGAITQSKRGSPT